MDLRPSSAHRWWGCTASTVASPTALPDSDIDAAREGTCAAWVAECIINGDATCVEDMVGKVHSNGWEVDADMARHLEPFIEIALKRESPVAEIRGEVRIGNHRLMGTADLRSFTREYRTLHIDDLKYGFDLVEVFENKQLLCYAYLQLAKMGKAPELVQFGIYQPRQIHRDGPYRKWVVRYDDLLPYFQDMVSWINKIDDAVPEASPGDRCNYCPRANDCMALTRSIYSMWQPVQDRLFKTPTAQQLADELTMLDQMSSLLKARETAVKAEAEIRIKRQEMIPGWSIVGKIGKRAFTYPPEVIYAMTGVDPYEKNVVTPAELERRGADKTVLKTMTHTPTVGYKLDRVDNHHIANMFEEK